MKRWQIPGIVVLLAAAGWIVWIMVANPVSLPAEFSRVETAARLEPDYAGVTIPPNIAPLNFRILTEGSRYLVVLTGGGETEIRAASRNGQIRFPRKAWRRMLAATAGGDLCAQVFVQNRVGWEQYPPFSITVAGQPVDPYLTYRLLRPQFNRYNDVGIYQRSLESFEQREIIHGRGFRDGCVNCHQLDRNKPGTMTFGVRSSVYGSGTMLIQGDRINKIGTNFGHTSWHPTGKAVAYSMFDVRMFFHTARTEVRDVVEFDSLLGYMILDGNKTKTVPAIADKTRLETQPSWSPDGKYLYFASAPKLWTDKNRFPPDAYDKLLYDINRISYDVQTDTWGSVETVVPAAKLGLSCLAPRVSPDGRWLLFSACAYGCFAIYQPSSDLYLMDLDNGQIHKLDCNSEFVDSWHSWSANSRWIAFSSKRPTGLFTHIYFAYIDESGKARKPFVLPQEDPEFYDSYLYAFNVPEMASWRIEVGKKALLDAIRAPATIKVDAVTMATPKKQDGDSDPPTTVPIR